MITANDLKDIDWFLESQGSIVNQPKVNKKKIKGLRIKIALELKKIKIKVKE